MSYARSRFSIASSALRVAVVSPPASPSSPSDCSCASEERTVRTTALLNICEIRCDAHVPTSRAGSVPTSPII